MHQYRTSWSWATNRTIYNDILKKVLKNFEKGVHHTLLQQVDSTSGSFWTWNILADSGIPDLAG